MAGRKNKQRDLKSGIYIIAEGLTEQCYLKHLKNILNYSYVIKPRFCDNTCFKDINNTIQGLIGSEVTICCIFDTDVVNSDSEVKKAFKELKERFKKEIDEETIILCDSFPSIEYWFLLHYKDTCPSPPDKSEIITKLKRFIKGYEKKQKFLDKEKWVNDMTYYENGGLGEAKKRAKKYSDTNNSYTFLYKAIEKFEE